MSTTTKTAAASKKQSRDWTFPIVSRYKDEDGHRNASIAIYNDGSEEWGQYRISVSHETWTGVRWFHIHQNDEAYTIEEAFETARQIRDQFGWVK